MFEAQGLRYVSARAALTRHCSLGALTRHFPQFWMPDQGASMVTTVTPREDSSRLADGRRLLVSSHGMETVSSLVSLPTRTLLSDQGPTLMTSFNLDYYLRGPTSKYNHTRGRAST